MIHLPNLILLLRPDLRRKYRFHLKQNETLYFLWLLHTGIKEYPSLAEDLSFKKILRQRAPGDGHSFNYLQYLLWIGRRDLQKAFPLPQSSLEFVRWFYTHGVLECGIWNFLSSRDKKKVLKQKDFWISRLTALQSITLPDFENHHTNTLPFGVNLIGYAYGQLGIGEDIRMAVKAFKTTSIPFTVINFPPGADISQNDHTIDQYVRKDGPYAINLFCLTALETGRFYAEKGISQFSGRYNIGYWPWELSKWPKSWQCLIGLVDEIWVSSQHTYDALLPICKCPLKLMPMAVDLGVVTPFSSPTKARTFFALPSKATLFCFAFDLKSQLHRKNPQACIEAFLRAFPASQFHENQVGLVIKVLKPAQADRQWDQLKQLASSDQRIHIIEKTLARADLLALYQSCHCYLSLHRAEGFGRGIAEALLLGVHVITTGYSGNLDFCKSQGVDLVSFQLMEVGKGQYPFGENQTWANPNISHAAQLMRNFFDAPRSPSTLTTISRFSPTQVGRRYRSRLKEIYKLYE